MNFLERHIHIFHELTRFRKGSIFFLIFVLLISQLFVTISFIAILFIPQVISSIRIPNGDLTINLNIDEPHELEVTMPYEIENPSLWDLTSIKLSLSL